MKPETSHWPDISNRVRVCAPHHLEALNAAGRKFDGRTIYLLDIWDPQNFISELPTEFQTPTNINPQAGLPPQAWAGYTILEMNSVDLKNLEKLLDIRARVRWIELVGNFPDRLLKKLLPFLGAWRCSCCGHRGTLKGKEKRPDKCPHAEVLCGDAKLLPQIHWLTGEDLPPWVVAKAKELGVVVTPEVPALPVLPEKQP